MANKPFRYDAQLVVLNVPNSEQDSFRKKLLEIPYLLYEVETLSNGDKIVINKPGGKRNFGRLCRDDFMVFIYHLSDNTLWLISHSELYDDIIRKKDKNFDEALEIVHGLYLTCCGKEPDDVINTLELKNTTGLSVETILKVYKWIWGQEDCNYPTKKGRWLSMDNILEAFGKTRDDFRE